MLPDDPTPDPVEDPTPNPDPAPAPESEEEFDKERALATIRKQRESEAAAKKRAQELEARLKEFEDRDKTEAQKLAEAREAAAREAEEAKAEVLRLRAAIKYGLDEEDLDLLGVGDEETIERRAKRLAERSAPPPDSSSRPRERLKPGTVPVVEPEETDPAKLAAQVPRGW